MIKNDCFDAKLHFKRFVDQALELAKMMPNKQSLELAARYCSKSGHVQLAERINKLLRTYDQVRGHFIIEHSISSVQED